METERRGTMIMESLRQQDGSFTININIEGDYDTADAVGHICKLAESFAEALEMDPERMVYLCLKHCNKFFTKEEDSDAGVPESTGGG